MVIKGKEIKREDILYVREFGDPESPSLTIMGYNGDELITLRSTVPDEARLIYPTISALKELGFMK